VDISSPGIPPGEHIHMTPRDRFMTYVQDEGAGGCWLWTGALNKDGYGKFWLDGRSIGAHRAAHLLFRGPLAHFCCHTCDTPRCVNPEHLFDGTPKANTADMFAKDRWVRPRPTWRRGEDHPNALLKNDDVRRIRAMLAERRLSQHEIGAAFGVSNSIVCKIKKGRLYAKIV
jgi:hypothetical protein